MLQLILAFWKIFNISFSFKALIHSKESRMKKAGSGKNNTVGKRKFLLIPETGRGNSKGFIQIYHLSGLHLGHGLKRGIFVGFNKQFPEYFVDTD